MALEKLGRPGQHEPDWIAIDSTGNKFPVEEKEKAEVPYYSQWWSYWKDKLTKRYSNTNIQRLPSQVRGWIAVIDCELKEWVCLCGIHTGYAAASCAFKQFGRQRLTVKDAIDSAVAFLCKYGILDLTDAKVLASGYYVIAVRYNG